MSDLDLIHKKLDQLDIKQDRLLDKIEATNIILAKNTTSLEIHERRTTASETRITTLEQDSIKRKALTTIVIKIGAFLVGISTVVATAFEVFRKP